MAPTSVRYTLDVARLAGEDIIRIHIARLKPSQAQIIEAHEKCQPGPVFIERTHSVPGDYDWTLVYRNPDFPAPRR